jgi:hypothetical protein
MRPLLRQYEITPIPIAASGRPGKHREQHRAQTVGRHRFKLDLFERLHLVSVWSN